MMCSVPYILRSGTALFPWGWMASALYLGSAAAGAAQILIRDRNDRQLLAELQEHVAALTHGELPLPQTVAAAARKLVDATEQGACSISELEPASSNSNWASPMPRAVMPRPSSKESPTATRKFRR